MTLRLNGSTSGFTEIDAPAVAGSNTLTLPGGAGSANQFLKNGNTAGSLGWSSLVEDSSGNVGIGTASPLGRLDSSWGGYGTSQAPALMIGANISANTSRTSSTRKMGLISGPHYDNGTDIGFIRFDSASTVTELQLGGTAEKRGATNISFYTATTNTATPSERVRINNTGTLSVYGPADNPSVNFSVSHGPGTHQSLAIYSGGSGTTSLGTKQFFVQNNGDVRNTNNSYGAISDSKLKENIVDANSQWDDLKALQVRNYNFKAETGYNTHTQIGLVAQEVELVSPALVGESIDEKTGESTKTVNYSVLYMKAVKALQEAMIRIEQLESDVATLKGN